MNENVFHSKLLRGAQERVEVCLLGVNSSVRKQAKQMQLMSLECALHCRDDRRMTVDLFRRNQRIDARDVHPHNSAGANIQVTNFAVSHLPIRQANEMV